MDRWTDDPGGGFRLAGFALAHAAWSVEDGETLVTLAMVDIDGQRELVRYEGDIRESIDFAQADLSARLHGGGYAALVYDGYLTPPDGVRTDALFVEVLGAEGRSIGSVAQLYRAGRRSRVPLLGRSSGFALLGVPILSDGVEMPDAERLLLEGARSHPKAGRYFNGDR